MHDLRLCHTTQPTSAYNFLWQDQNSSHFLGRQHATTAAPTYNRGVLEPRPRPVANSRTEPGVVVMVMVLAGAAALCRRAGGAVVAGTVRRHVLAAVRLVPLLVLVLVLMLVFHRASRPAATGGKQTSAYSEDIT